MKIILLIFSLLCLNTSLQGQYQNSNWINSFQVICIFKFGSGNEPPRYDYVNYQQKVDAYHACYTNNNGLIKYYSNGLFLYNYDFQIIPNGKINIKSNVWQSWSKEGMPGWYGGAFLESFSKDSILYYVYPSPENIDSFGAGMSRLLCAKIKMQNDSILFKDSLLYEDTQIQPAFIRHANGRDWWIVTCENGFNNYKIVLIKDDSISVKSQTIGKSFDNKLDPGYGWAEFSPDGSKYARNNGYLGIVVMDFDRCMGIFSNPKFIEFTKPGPFEGLGANISPNNRFLYSNTRHALVQFDLEAPDIQASKDTVALWDKFVSGFDMDFAFGSYGIDGKIYYTAYNGSLSIHVIDRPDLKGRLCNARQHSYTMPTKTGLSGPPLFVNYNLGKLETACE